LGILIFNTEIFTLKLSSHFQFIMAWGFKQKQVLRDHPLALKLNVRHHIDDSFSQAFAQFGQES
jgi:hypothetical protein